MPRLKAAQLSERNTPCGEDQLWERACPRRHQPSKHWRWL